MAPQTFLLRHYRLCVNQQHMGFNDHDVMGRLYVQKESSLQTGPFDLEIFLQMWLTVPINSHKFLKYSTQSYIEN